MKIFKRLNDYKKLQQKTKKEDTITYIALGFFDGIHLGHQNLLSHCVRKAIQDQAISTVILFDPHPEKIVYGLKNFLLLTTLHERVQKIKKLGIQQIITINFAEEFQKISAENFVTEVLLKQLHMGAVFVGKNYHFGYQKRGNVILLEKLAQLYHFKTFVLDLKKINGYQEISSTLIKEELKNGNIIRANQLLGYYYQLSGEVIHGDKRGNLLLSFPTANIHIPKDKLLPKNGVYIAFARIGQKKYQGLVNIGYKPTFTKKNDSVAVEMNLFDFKGELYGKKISISLIQRIRDEIQFSNSDSLVLQIKKDEIVARNLFNQFEFGR